MAYESTIGANASSITSAIEKKVLQCYESLYMDIDDGVFITNAPQDIKITDSDLSGKTGVDSSNAATFISVGQFLGFSAVQEEKLFTTSEVTVSLSGLPSHELGTNFISDILQYDYVDKDVRIYRTFFDHDTHIGSFLIFKGRVDSPVIQDDPAGTTTLAATCSSHWVDYERSNGMITNDNRHKEIYSGDKGFEFANIIVQDIQWKE